MMKYTSKEITKLFGKPTQITVINHNQYSFEYILDPPCPAVACSILYFTFDNLDRFKEVNRTIMH